MGDADHFLRYRRRRLVGNVPGSLGELIKSLLLAYCDGGEPRAKSQFVIELDADAFERPLEIGSQNSFSLPASQSAESRVFREAAEIAIKKPRFWSGARLGVERLGEGIAAERPCEQRPARRS
jgi:hypothetical protein